ncbi:MAG TPA: DUF4062 domain-containing protein [Allosphingosinicella sp.]|nr:DUF4062 domain-containing protein [Allosphingosinicella sp.]
MSGTLRLLRVFLASPGDLPEERIAARDAVKEVNDLVARPAGYHVDLIGWEDTISEARRPQAVINDDLDQCDLFIGMLHARWGTPPDINGTYSSGFEEEYARSRERHTQSGKPDLKLFFKTVDDARLKDVGPELQKVLDFKKAVIEEKAILFQLFDTPLDLARMVRAAVASHIQRLIKEGTVATQDDLAQAPRASDNASTLQATDTTGESSPDADFLARLSVKLDRESTEITAPEVARLRLVGASVSRSGNADPDLGVHDANLLYAELAHGAFSAREINALLDCGLGRMRLENTPVWQWLYRAEQKDEDALAISTFFGEASKRVGALELLRLLERDVDTKPPIERSWIIESWFRAPTSSAVRNAALRYLGARGTLPDLKIVEQEIAEANSQTISGAIEAALAIQLRHDGADAARLILNSSFESLDKSLLAQGLSHLRQLAPVEIRPGLDHRSPIVRAAVLAHLGDIGEVDNSTVLRAVSDESTEVRLAALAILDKDNSKPVAEIASMLAKPKRGRTYLFLTRSSLDEQASAALVEIKRKRFEKASLETVTGIALGSSEDRDLAWLVKAERQFAAFAEELRHHIDDRFIDFHMRRWGQDDENPLQSGRASALLGFAPAAGVIRRRDLIRSALDILLKRRDSQDLGRLRKLIDEEAMSFSEEDVLYLRDKGGWEDVSRLSLIGSKSMGGLLSGDSPYLETTASSAILRLAQGRERELLTVGLSGNILARVIVSMSDMAFSALPDAALGVLLQDRHDAVRRATALKMVKALPRKQNQAALKRYLGSGEQRYYNVIFWLDLADAFPVKRARVIAGRALNESKREGQLRN